MGHGDGSDGAEINFNARRPILFLTRIYASSTWQFVMLPIPLATPKVYGQRDKLPSGACIDPGQEEDGLSGG